MAAWPILCGAQGAESPGREDLVEALTRRLPDDTFGNVERFVTNGFQIESSHAREIGRDFEPTGRTMALLEVAANDMFRVGIEKGREGMSLGGGVAIFHRDTGEPMLSVGDVDGDGSIDVLTYSVFDASGVHLLEVIDYEADGQPDMRIHFKERYFEIWHIDRWYRAETKGERPGIVIDGEFIELQRGNNRWIVP